MGLGEGFLEVGVMSKHEQQLGLFGAFKQVKDHLDFGLLELFLDVLK
jgi:hypothetical protein